MFSFSSKIPGENGLAGYFEAPSDPPTGPFWGTDLVTKISKHNSKTPTLLTMEFLERKKRNVGGVYVGSPKRFLR